MKHADCDEDSDSESFTPLLDLLVLPHLGGSHSSNAPLVLCPLQVEGGLGFGVGRLIPLLDIL